MQKRAGGQLVSKCIVYLFPCNFYFLKKKSLTRVHQEWEGCVSFSDIHAFDMVSIAPMQMCNAERRRWCGTEPKQKNCSPEKRIFLVFSRKSLLEKYGPDLVRSFHSQIDRDRFQQIHMDVLISTHASEAYRLVLSFYGCVYVRTYACMHGWM